MRTAFTVAVAIFWASAIVAQENDSSPNDFRQTLERASGGDVVAQSALGAMFSLGEGVPQDYAEAVKWYRKAAEQGDMRAEALLGGMYEAGEGIKQDYTQAATWYRKAAEKGEPTAQMHLGRMHAVGRGMPEDYVEAYKWFNLSATLWSEVVRDLADIPEMDGNVLTEQLELAQKLRTLMVGKMTPEQVAEGQKRSAEWWKEYKAKK